MEPHAEPLRFPAEYGEATEPMAWSEARRKLEEATVYWLATVRADGTPHVVPRDGVWLAERLWYGGSDETVHNRIIAKRPAVTLHIGEGLEAVIVEGIAERRMPSEEEAQELAERSMAKYPQYGTQSASDYVDGVWTIVPRRVLAWTRFPTNGTRFRFER